MNYTLQDIINAYDDATLKLGTCIRMLNEQGKIVDFDATRILKNMIIGELVNHKLSNS